jgi:hypothetical protein
LSGTATPTFHNITVNASSTLSLPASFTTVVNGNFTINGTLSANSSSTVRFAGNNNTQAVSGSGTVTFGNVAVSKANSRTELVLFPLPPSLTYHNPLHFGHSSMTINNFTLDSGLVYFSPVTGSGTFTRTISGNVTIGSTPSSIFGNGLPSTPIRANTVLIINNRAGATVNTTVNGSILEGPGSGYVTLILAGKDCNNSSSSTLTVNGDFTFNLRPVSWNGNGTTPPSGVGSMTFNFAGNISITNPLSIFNGDRAGTGSPPTINLTGSGKTVNIPPVVFLGGGSTTGGTNAQAFWVIPPTASITIPSTGALAINIGRSLTVNGTLTCADGAQLIGTATGPGSGNPTFTLGSSGILRVADVDGLGDGTLLDPTSNFPLFIRRTSPGSGTPGNWVLSAINTAGTIEYNGTGQTVTPRNTTLSNNYFNLVFSGGNKTLGGDVDATNSLTLNGGIITTGTNDLTLTNASATSLTYNNGHINGRLVRAIGTTSDDYLYPIGDASTYRPVTLTAQASTFNAFLRGRLENSPGSTISSSYETPLVGVSQLRYYEFENRSNAATITITQASLQVSSDDGVLTPDNTRVATFLDNDPYWSNRGGSISIVPSTITSTSAFSNTIPAGSNNFWYAALGTTNLGDNPLPVELLSFTATSTAQGIKLAWETASEHESRGFTLLRKKQGESAWIEVASYQTDNALRAHNSLNGASYTYTDKTPLEVGKVYEYQLRETGFDGQVTTLQTLTLTIRFNVARAFELAQNYPNPFNPTTTIRYQIPTAEVVSLKVYDVLGKEVATLVSGRQEAGSYAVEFNAAGLSSGVYFYRLQAGGFVETKKMMLVK